MLKNVGQIIGSPIAYRRRVTSMSLLLLPFLEELAKIDFLSALIIGLFTEIKDGNYTRTFKSALVVHIQFKIQLGMIDIRCASRTQTTRDGKEYSFIAFRVAHLKFQQRVVMA